MSPAQTERDIHGEGTPIIPVFSYPYSVIRSWHGVTESDVPETARRARKTDDGKL